MSDRYAIGYIHPGQVSSYFCTSMLTTMLWDFEQSGARGGRRIANVYQEWSSANVSASRNIVTQRFLDRPDDGDWLLWIDSDMEWTPTDVDMLLDAADPVERPVVGGLCFGMTPDGLFPTLYQFAEIDGQLTTFRVPEYRRDALVQCAATGAAFLLIHRSVLQRMKDHGFNAAFPFFQEVQAGDKPVGEDVAFCLRLGALGVKVFVHTGVRIGHHKSQVLVESMFLKQQLEAATEKDATAHG